MSSLICRRCLFFLLYKFSAAAKMIHTIMSLPAAPARKIIVATAPARQTTMRLQQERILRLHAAPWLRQERLLRLRGSGQKDYCDSLRLHGSSKTENYGITCGSKENDFRLLKGIVSRDWQGLQMVSLDRFEV
jgi:hypothetical protein